MTFPFCRFATQMGGRAAGIRWQWGASGCLASHRNLFSKRPATVLPPHREQLAPAESSRKAKVNPGGLCHRLRQFIWPRTLGADVQPDLRVWVAPTGELALLSRVVVSRSLLRQQSPLRAPCHDMHPPHSLCLMCGSANSRHRCVLCVC